MDLPQGPASIYTNQNTRAYVTCSECRKPRVIYSKKSLGERQQNSLTMALCSYDYTCGAAVLPGSCRFKNDIMVRPSLRCNSPIETQYYSLKHHEADLCVHCACSEAFKPDDSLRKFKKVAPICFKCLENGLEPIQSMPYGRK